MQLQYDLVAIPGEVVRIIVSAANKMQDVQNSFETYVRPRKSSEEFGRRYAVVRLEPRFIGSEHQPKEGNQSIVVFLTKPSIESVG